MYVYTYQIRNKFASIIILLFTSFLFTVECDQFRATPFDVNFPNGTTLATFSINIINDDIYEEDETFTLDILNSFPSFVVLGDPSTATVVIQEDEDRKLCNISIFSLPVQALAYFAEVFTISYVYEQCS